MQIVPLQPVPKQYLQVQLDGQNTQINLYTTIGGLFMDVLVDDVAIISGVICQNLNPIVQNGYLGFSGDLAFMDMQGSSDPEYTGLGSRYLLAYLSASEL